MVQINSKGRGAFQGCTASPLAPASASHQLRPMTPSCVLPVTPGACACVCVHHLSPNGATYLLRLFGSPLLQLDHEHLRAETALSICPQSVAQGQQRLRVG